MPRLDQARCVATTKPGARCKNRAVENHLCERHQHLAKTPLWERLAVGGGKIAFGIALKEVLERILEAFLQGDMRARVPHRLAESLYAPGVDLARVEYELLVWFTEQDDRIQHMIQGRVGR